MKKTIAILLLVSMLGASILSCAAQEENEGVSGASTNAVTDEETTTDEPALPDYNGNGDTFRMLIRQADTYTCDDVCVETLNGEIVNDAVYNRDLTVESRFNIVIEPNYNSDVASIARKSITAGDDICDVMFDSMCSFTSLMTSRYLLDLNTLDNISWDAVYWDSNAAEQLSVLGKLYMAVSDISMNASSRARFIYFNKQLVEDYNLTSPYEYVYSNGWTLDVFGEMVKNVSEDLNGDGKMNGNDRFGILQEGASFFISGAGVRLTKNDDEGVPQVAFNDERTVDVLAKIKEIISDKAHAISYESAAAGMDTSGYAHIYNFGRSLFASDHFLFVQNGANVANQFANMESAFGIVPNPKYNETQESYYHLMDKFACASAVPVTASNYEKISVVMEYMSWLSSKTLVPAYYETTIKVKRFNDDDAPVMLDLVRASILYEISNIADLGVEDVINSAYSSGNLASSYAKKEEAIATKIAKFVDNFR